MFKVYFGRGFGKLMEKDFVNCNEAESFALAWKNEEETNFAEVYTYHNGIAVRIL